MTFHSEENSARAKLALSMFIFGTIGIFRRGIVLPSSIIAMVRAVVGTLFLLGLILAKRQKIDREAVRKNLWLLILSGILLGFNWILLFEAYQYTSVATATLCYYMAPIFIILASPLLLKEKLTLRKGLCVVVALGGMVLVSGFAETGISGIGEMKGVLFGLAAAVFYASVVLLNKGIRDISAYDKTIMQLGIAAVVLLPYTLLTENWSSLSFDTNTVVMLLIMGIVHTGFAYAMYFGTTRVLSAQTLALFSYIDPIVAVLLSALVLKESMSVLSLVGAVAVLGSTIVSELPEKTHKA
ncbi:MAG: EamA family transporter [Oscillospiraceae bacterium]|nr:EamA family transporter [Oscillospiraceae bacterium]